MRALPGDMRRAGGMITRARWGSSLPTSLHVMNYILQPGYFIVYLKMLLGIKERAERTSPIEQTVEERAWRNEGRSRQLHLWLPGLPCPLLCSERNHLLRQRFPGLHFLLELDRECRNLFPLCVGCRCHPRAVLLSASPSVASCSSFASILSKR